jgi:hypothetical protein
MREDGMIATSSCAFCKFANEWAAKRSKFPVFSQSQEFGYEPEA